MRDSVRNFNHLMTIYELSKLYFKLENNEKVNHYDSLGLSIAQQIKNLIVTFEFINNKAQLAIKKKQFGEAKNLIEKTLSIVQKTIQKIDGKVTLISSEIGKESIFEIRFPLKKYHMN